MNIKKQIHPMGALAAKPDKIEALYRDPNYVAEKKFDGSRYVFQHQSGLYTLTSRRESVKGGMVEKSSNVPQIITELNEIPNQIILDGEIDIPIGRNFHYVQGCMGSLPERALTLQTGNPIKIEIIKGKPVIVEGYKLVFKIFDILELDGENLRIQPLYERRNILETLFKMYDFKYCILVEQYKDKDKRTLFDKEIQNGAEGIILKNLNSVYVEDKKPCNSWYKIKKVQTFDGIVTGYVPGNGKYLNTLGTLTISQYKDGQLVETAEISGMTDALRDEFKKRLDAGEKNIIVEFEAQEPEKNRYRHPRFLRERTDKNPKECIYGKS